MSYKKERNPNLHPDRNLIIGIYETAPFSDKSTFFLANSARFRNSLETSEATSHQLEGV